MTTTSRNRTPQVLTEYDYLNAVLDRLEAHQQEAQRQHEQHQQHTAQLAARIETAHRIAQRIIDDTREVQ